MIEYEYYSEPAPHIFLPKLLPTNAYRDLVFPKLERSLTGRIGRDLYDGEPGYGALVSSPGWTDLHALFTSERFVKWTVRIFADDLARLGCEVDPTTAFFEPYVESRDQVRDVRAAISDRDANALFTRFDIQAADATYEPYVHLDRIRRLTGGVLFCTDPAEEGLLGGEFAFYRDRWFADDRRCLWPKRVKTFPVRPNTGVIFLNANTAFHGPRPISALRGLRKWVYHAVSSHRAIWPYQRSSGPRSLALKGKKTLQAVREQATLLFR
jgi:hypothetical protein